MKWFSLKMHILNKMCQIRLSRSILHGLKSKVLNIYLLKWRQRKIFFISRRRWLSQTGVTQNKPKTNPQTILNVVNRFNKITLNFKTLCKIAGAQLLFRAIRCSIFNFVNMHNNLYKDIKIVFSKITLNYYSVTCTWICRDRFIWKISPLENKRLLTDMLDIYKIFAKYGKIW